MVGDRDYKTLSRGFYYALIQQAFEKLALDTYFDEKREDFDLPDSLTIPLPETCFNVKNVYMFQGNICDVTSSKKVYWKRNYFTKGNGYIANDKGNHNAGDPFYDNHGDDVHFHGDQTYARFNGNVEHRLFYNIQQGNIMFSSSCKNHGKVHIHYNGSGCKIGDAPIIPIFLRTAMEDFVTEAALRFKMANDPTNYKMWRDLQSEYKSRLLAPYTGSWEQAEYRVKTLNSSQREELKEYLGRGAWASGF
ncbi:MAG TPA: hypothetical protein ACFYEK_01450 [Candidatus Wunengus sp. YC60]|uniref:hypothetical protein n=1 Tax=Candidatus Wunengus sp. YC60 TaxID=3367697 RepID=UPI0040253D54